MKSYTLGEVVVTLNNQIVKGASVEEILTTFSEYKQITSPEEIPENGIVYQWDCGFWYDWDLSGKCEGELENLFTTNLIYVKVGE